MMINSKILKSKKNIVFILIALTVFQIGSWFFWGKNSLDDHIFFVSVKETIDSYKKYRHEDYPDFFFINTDLEESLSASTLDKIKIKLERKKISLIFRKDLGPDATIPGENTESSRVSIEICRNTPLFAVVDLYQGHGPTSIVTNYFVKDVYVYVLGKWFRISRKV